MANPSSDLKSNEEEAARIEVSFAEFGHQMNIARERYRTGNLGSAAVYASIAASVAAAAHCGFFVSPSLERLLFAIGKQVADSRPPLRLMRRAKSYARVLHVCTSVFSTGGHSKMLRLWIESDRRRIHS